MIGLVRFDLSARKRDLEERVCDQQQFEMFRPTVMFALLWCLAGADWASYKRDFNKEYGPKEDVFRRRLYETNLENMNAHNALFDRKLTTDRKYPTEFSDMSSEGIAPADGEDDSSDMSKPFESFSLPMIAETQHSWINQRPLQKSVDYRNHPCMSRVKNQNEDKDGNCSDTAWSFAATGLLEYYYCDHTGDPVNFSEKYLVDCSPSGCDGGSPEQAMQYVMAEKKIAFEEAYPYHTDEALCPEIREGYDLSSLVSYEVGTGDQYLMKVLASRGPAVVAFFANFTAFNDFKTTDENEIFEHWECEFINEPRHDVLAVGYGTNDNGDYWIIKNSRGPEWGLNGYAKIRRGVNYCNIADFIMTPVFV